MHVPVNREERRRHGVVHPAVHVDEAEVIQVLVSGEAAVEHRGSREVSAPGDACQAVHVVCEGFFQVLHDDFS